MYLSTKFKGKNLILYSSKYCVYAVIIIQSVLSRQMYIDSVAVTTTVKYFNCLDHSTHTRTEYFKNIQANWSDNV